MFGHVEVENLTTIVTDHEEAVEHAEPESWNGEEVYRRDGFPVIPQKCEPTFGQFRVPRRSFHPAGDRLLGNIESQHEKLPMDARRSPGGILRDHLEDQFPHLLWNLSPPNRSSHLGNQLPIQSEAGPMPSDHRFRGDHDECPFPFRPEPLRQHPEDLLEYC